MQKTPLTDESIKRHSTSLDSKWDGTESSVTTSSLIQNNSESKETKRQSRDTLKMLHQIQADVLVKKKLLGHIEKQRGQFTQLKENYNEKLSELKTQLERIENPPTSRQYEIKLKRLASDNLELKKNLTQTTHQIHQSRTKASSSIKKLNSSMETLQIDNKQFKSQIKHVSGKTREMDAKYQRDIQHLKKRIHVVLEAKKKIEKSNEIQANNLQKRSEETVAAAMQLRQLINELRKAASEGSFLNETACEKILSSIARK